MNFLYYSLLSCSVALLVSGCGKDKTLPQALKKPKVHQIIDADTIEDSEKIDTYIKHSPYSAEGTMESFPYVYDNVDATRAKDLENNKDNGNYLNEQQELSRAVAEANGQIRRP